MELLGTFKDFHLNYPHLHSLSTGRSRLIKGYVHEDFCKVM